MKFIKIMLKNPVSTSKETHYVSITKASQLVLFKEMITTYFKN
jgi:hypothetical protein